MRYCLSLQGKKANNFYHIDEKYFTASSGPNFTAIAANDIHILTQKYTPNKENGDPAKRNHIILLDIPYGTGKTEEVYKVTKNEEVLLGTAKTKKYFGVYSSYIHLGGSATAPLIIGRTEYDFSKKKYTNNVLDVNLRSAGYKKILKNKDNTKASLAVIEKNPNAQGIIFTFHGIGCLLDGAIMCGHINCVHGANVSTINGGSYH